MESKKSRFSTFLDTLQEKNPTLYFVLDLLLNIFVIVILVYSVRTYLISPFQVYGPSMCNTLNDVGGECQEGFGEYLIVNKSIYYPFFGHSFSSPQRGDIIVFRPPHNTKDFYIKRVIGLPGEQVKIQNGKVYIVNKEHQSGYELPEPYLSSENLGRTFLVPTKNSDTYTVPAGYYFVLGDNRNKSTDSRTCFRGAGDPECYQEINHYLPADRIEGKAWLVLWPFTKIRSLQNPNY